MRIEEGNLGGEVEFSEDQKDGEERRSKLGAAEVIRASLIQ